MKFSNKFIKAMSLLCDFESHVNAPYFRKKFSLDFDPSDAEITICGLGFYELYINGENITKGPLAPYISNCDDVCYYDNYNISHLLKKGENVIGILLGNGFRNAFGGFVWDFDKASCRGPLCVALCLEAKSDEGKTFQIEADKTFKIHPSPITFDDIRMGYQYDANLEIPNWNTIDFDDSKWDNAKKCKAPKGEMKLCTAEPIKETMEIKAVDIKHYDSRPFAYKTTLPGSEGIEESIRENVYAYDFGVNAAGVTKLKINGKKGQKITIRHGEFNVNDRFSINTSSFVGEGRDPEIAQKYLEYNQKDVFICKGGEEEFIPKFKFDGFRYAFVEGLEEGQATRDAVTYLVMNSDFEERASFECSDKVLNKLFENSRRSDLANFYYFPMDCPHREKNGWTGDASNSAEHMMLNLTVEKSFKEWLLNIRKAQNKQGALPGIVPTGGWGFKWGNGPVWDAVIVNLPYFVYKYTGDKEIIEENADAIIKYFKYAKLKRDEKGLVAYGLPDWCSPADKDKRAPLVVTDSIEIFDIAKKAAFLFNEIGRKEESIYAEELAESMRNSIREHLIDFNTYTVMGDCQTCQAIAIERGIFNEGKELRKAREKLIEIIHRDGDKNTCGMTGLRYIFHTLAKMGEAELAYKIITSKEPGCYGYWIKNGATSMWESFGDLNSPRIDSRNHHFHGDISSWLIQHIAGIQPNPNANDLSYVCIAPNFLEELSYAKAHYNSKYGKVESYWDKRCDERFITWEITVPEGMNAKLVLPHGYAFTNAATTVEIPAGTYKLPINKKLKGFGFNYLNE